MLSDKSTVCPNNLLDIAQQKRGIKAAIVNAGKELPMLSVIDAVKEKLIIPVLIGEEDKIREICKSFSLNKSNQEQNLIESLKTNCRKAIKEKTGKRPYTNVNLVKI